MSALFIFRRDFRLHDNLALNELAKLNLKVITIFIFDPSQLTNSYASKRAITFMIESLKELSNSLKSKKGKLYLAKGDPPKVIDTILRQNPKIQAVAFNRDFSPYSVTRDNKIIQICKKKNVQTITSDLDLVIHPYDAVLTAQKTPYTVFGSYYKKASKIKPPKPTTSNIKWDTSARINQTTFDTHTPNIQNTIKGGRSHAIQILNKIKNKKFLSNYTKTRDNISNPTSLLSPHLKFGTISIREAFPIFKKANPTLTKQLYWRNHYFVLAYYRPAAGYYKAPPEYNKAQIAKTSAEWKRRFKAMWTGQTGFPIIDASVRQLNETGWMHNRGRLATANFSIKILHLGMESGQAQFSKQLIDCCYANNFGNWMWILGPNDPGGFRYGKKGTFSGRIFREAVNPKKIDPDLKFIRTWIPELKDIPDHHVARWDIHHTKYQIKYKPIVDFDKQLQTWFKMTKKS